MQAVLRASGHCLAVMMGRAFGPSGNVGSVF